MIEFDICQTKEELSRRREDWVRVHSSSAGVHHPFTQFEWVENCAHHLNGPGDLSIIFSADGQTLLPLILQKGFLSSAYLLGDAFFDYRDALLPQGGGDLTTLLDRQRSARIVFNRLREDSPLWDVLKDRVFLQYEKVVRPSVSAPFIGLSGKSWEQYQAQLRKKFRNDLSRQIRRLRDKGRLEFGFCKNKEQLKFYQGILYQQHILRRRQIGQSRSVFLDEYNREYFNRLNESVLASGSLRLFYLNLEGVPLALSLCYEYEHRLYYYTPTFDTQFTPFSPGRVLFYHILEYAFQNGIVEIDLMGGGEDYKYDWLAEDRATFDVSLFRKTLGGGAAKWIDAVDYSLRCIKAALIKSPLRKLKQKIYRMKG